MNNNEEQMNNQQVNYQNYEQQNNNSNQQYNNFNQQYTNFNQQYNMNYQAPNWQADNAKANKLSLISLLCLAAPIVLLILGSSIGYIVNDVMQSEIVNNIYLVFLNIMRAIVPLSNIVGLVIMIIVRVNYPQNKFGKIMMVIYIVYIVLVIMFIILSMILAMFMAAACAHMCSEISAILPSQLLY